MSYKKIINEYYETFLCECSTCVSMKTVFCRFHIQTCCGSRNESAYVFVNFVSMKKQNLINDIQRLKNIITFKSNM